jgi:subtilase family serine protease
MAIQGEDAFPLDLCTTCDPHHSASMPVTAHPLTATVALTVPKGLTPYDLWDAYGLVQDEWNALATLQMGFVRQGTIAIVDVGGYPTAEHDLGMYSQQYDLPPCTEASGCLTITNQYGSPLAATLPATDSDWAVEQALDLQMAHALCPVCKLVLVQAQSATFDNLLTAEGLALSLHPTAVSNSWGAQGELSEPPATCDSAAREHQQCYTKGDVLSLLQAAFTISGTVTTFSSGDNGFGSDFPADLPWVVAVGGTTLHYNPWSTRGWSEYAWSGAGSGCSAWLPKPTEQMDICPHRTIADVAFVADPASGVSIYDSTPYWSTRHHDNRYGWLVVGGTSVGAPAIAGLYGLAGDPQAARAPLRVLYTHESSLNDVTVGASWPRARGAYHKWNYLGTAGRGYDGPTGLGSPDGLGAF